MSGHNVLLYRGTDEFLTRVGGFVQDGLAAGDRLLVIASPDKLAGLRDAVGSDAAAMEQWDSAAAYRPQARIFQVTVDYLNEQPRRPTRLVAEQDLQDRSDVEIAAYLRQEAAANVVYRDFPVSVLCAYDTATIAPGVMTQCRQTHRGLLQDGRLVPNPEYVDPAAFLTAAATAPEPPPSAHPFTCETADDLATARELVAGEAAKAGLGREMRADLVVAANEVLTNALTHGTPPVRMYLYQEGQAVVCHVRDQGPGLADPLVGFAPPSKDATSSRGLLLARQLCDSVEIATDELGTHVRLLMLRA